MELNTLTSTDSDEQKDTDEITLNHVKEGDFSEAREYIENCMKHENGSRIGSDCVETSVKNEIAHGVFIKLEPNHDNTFVKCEPTNSVTEFNDADLHCGQRLNTNTICEGTSSYVLSSCLDGDVCIKVEPNQDNNIVKGEPSNCMNYRSGLNYAGQQFDQTFCNTSDTNHKERSSYLLSICNDDVRIKDKHHKTGGRLVSGGKEHCTNHYKYTNRSKMGDDCDEESAIDGYVDLYGVHIKLEPNHGNNIVQIGSSNCMKCETGLDDAATECDHTFAYTADTCKERTSCRLNVCHDDVRVKDEPSQSRELNENSKTYSVGPNFNAMQTKDATIEQQYNYTVHEHIKSRLLRHLKQKQITQTNKENMETGKQQNKITHTNEERMETGTQQPKITQANEERMETGTQQPRITQTNEERIEKGTQQPRITHTSEERMETGKQQTWITQTNEERMETGKQQTKINQTNEERMDTGKRQNKVIIIIKRAKEKRMETEKQQTRISQTNEERMQTGKQQFMITQTNEVRMEARKQQTKITQTNKERVETGKQQTRFTQTNKERVETDIRDVKRSKIPQSNENQIYKCDLCQFNTQSMGDHKRHIKENHPFPYRCDFCEYTTVHFRKIRFHRMRHTGERPYKCDLCDYGSIYLHRFKEHKRKHTWKTYTCEVCGYTTYRPLTFERHKEKHK